jgi:polysaccharide export outer membrane protein
MNNFNMRLRKATLAVMASLALCSCHTSRKILYYQDLTPTDSVVSVPAPQPIRIRPADQLSILVNCSDSRLTELFTLMTPTRRFGGGSGKGGSSVTSSNGQTVLYTVDSKGNIEFPVLGTLHVEGMTREDITHYIHDEIVNRDLAKDPIVTVEYGNLGVTVYGEVGGVGRYNIDREGLTVMDVLAQAGDLTIQGKRDRVWVYRLEDGQRRAYQLDLRNASQLTASPAYYVQQNDEIYVEPNMTKMSSSTTNGSLVRSASFWISMVSFVTSMLILIF